MELYDYKALIINWAEEREAFTKWTLQGQYDKIVEESEELIEAIENNDYWEMVDGVGDTFVTLIILEEMIKRKFYRSFKIDFEELGHYARTVDEKCIEELRGEVEGIGCGIDVEDIDWVENSTKYILAIIKKIASDKLNVSLEFCADYAYNEIKDRTGHVDPSSGNYVKDK